MPRKKRQTGDEIMAEFDAMLEQNPLTDLRQTVGPKITVNAIVFFKVSRGRKRVCVCQPR